MSIETNSEKTRIITFAIAKAVEASENTHTEEEAMKYAEEICALVGVAYPTRDQIKQAMQIYTKDKKSITTIIENNYKTFPESWARPETFISIWASTLLINEAILSQDILRGLENYGLFQ